MELVDADDRARFGVEDAEELGAPRLPLEPALINAALQADCKDLACFSSLMADSTVESGASAICLILPHSNIQVGSPSSRIGMASPGTRLELTSEDQQLEEL